MYCPSCGNEIFDHASICTQCGSIINLPPEMTEAELRRLRNRYHDECSGRMGTGESGGYTGVEGRGGYGGEGSGRSMGIEEIKKRTELLMDYVPALYASRVFAFVVDWGIIAGLGIYLKSQYVQVSELISLMMPLWAFLYFSIFTAIVGRTIGKFIVGIKVIGTSGNRPPTFLISIGRTAAYIVSFLFLMAGFLSPFFDAKSRAWHDILAGTRVIYQR